MKIVTLLCAFVFALVSIAVNAIEIAGVKVTVEKVNKKQAPAKPSTKKQKKAKKVTPVVAVAVVPQKSPGEIALEARNAELEAERVRNLVDLNAARMEAQEAMRLTELAIAERKKKDEEMRIASEARETAKLAEQVENIHPAYAEMGIRLASSIGVSASPIAGVGVTPRTGYGVTVVGSTGFKNVDYTMGFARQVYEFSLEGVTLGSILSTTLEAGARYNFTMSDKRIVPFVGAGLYNTKFDGHTLLGSTLKVNGISVSGVVVEAGARYQIKQRYYVGASFRQYFGETGYNRLMTNFGSAQLTMYNLSNARTLVLSAGGNFD